MVDFILHEFYFKTARARTNTHTHTIYCGIAERSSGGLEQPSGSEHGEKWAELRQESRATPSFLA